MAAAAEEPQRLSELLESGWRLLEEVESSAEASSGAPAVQRKVQHGIGLLERAARAIAELQLFSRNEELDEVASADLRFMLVPALLGALVLKQQPGGGAAAAERRLEHVQRARGLFLDFLRLCADYGVGPTEMPAEEPGEPRQREREGGGGLEAAAARRRAKIERYKQKKEVENQLASLKTLIDRAQAEEEQLREFYLLHIRKWVSTSLEEIESIDQEIEILTQRDALKQQVQKSSRRSRKKKRQRKKRRKPWRKHGNGTTGRTCIRGAMATGRTWADVLCRGELHPADLPHILWASPLGRQGANQNHHVTGQA
uniref:Immunoglobulin-binding protein 1 n=1 Tax=Salvator merianae TaxID=96440 RepID=A0A8D0BG79_SALMN